MSAVDNDGSIGVHDLKTHLYAVLEEVIGGRQVTVTCHGHPIAMLNPVASPVREQRRRAIQGIREIAKTAKPLPAGVTIESLYKEGRV